MKPYFFAFLFLSLLTTCDQNKSLVEKDRKVYFKNSEGTDAAQNIILVSGNHHYTLSKDQLPYQKVVLLSSSLLGYFTALGLEDKIVGLSSVEYVYHENIKKRYQKNLIQEVGNEQKYDLEKIIALKPDVVFTNYISTFQNAYDILRKNKIQVIFVDEYLEENPLEKASIIKIFGVLLGKEQTANKIFSQVKKNYLRYSKLAASTSKKPLVLSNEMYGGQWYVAGAKSQLAHFIKDAHAEYLFSDQGEEKSLPKSFEEVFVKAQKADYWVNVGNHKSKKELLAIQPLYAKMKIYEKGEIYALTGKETLKANDYFESGTIRADLVLRDYIAIFHPELFPKDSLVYMKRLK